MLKVERSIDYLKKGKSSSETFEGAQHVKQITSQRKTLRFKRSDDNPELPENFKVGQAIGGGDCFFDSVAKGLKQLKPEMNFTVKSLREVCKRFAQNQLENDQSWLKGALRNEAEPISVYVPRIEFTADDIEQKSGSVNVLGLTSPIWGRSEIEGRIICKEYNVKLHVVEKHVVEGKEVWLDQIVNSEGSRSVDSIDYNEENTIHIINRGNAHFEPILGTQEIRHNKQQSPDPSDYDDEITPEEELVSTIKSSESEGEKLARIKRLFDKEPKPNINFQGVNGNTPLHIAVRKKELKVIEYLVKNGAKIDIKNGKSRTSLDIAKRLQRQDIVQILESRIQQVFVEEQSAEQKKSSKENKLEDIGQKNERVEQEKRISYSDKLLLENKGEVSINQVEQHKFNRRQGTAGISGQLYEINLSMLFLLQGVTKKEDGKIDSFYLATNMEEAGDFDDVVFKYKYKDQGGIEKSKIIFLQAKHREKVKKEISLKTLLAESEKGDFLLKRYFSSYREIKQQFSEKGNVGDPIFGSNFKDSDFIIYTNALFTYGTSEEKNIKKIDEEKESILNLKEENNHYYQLTFGGNKEKKIIDTLKYSSDCKKLAKELAECIFSGEVININKPIFGKYHTALVEKVIEKNKLKESTLRKSFLDGDESLSPGDKKFREAFFEEIQKIKEFKGKAIGELESGLSGKGIKLHKKFGDAKRNDPKLPLPSDLVNEDEIKEFLSKLKLFVGRVNEGELGKVVKQKIQSTYKVEQNDVNLIFSDVQNKIQKWWKEENKYLTENNKLFEDAKQNLSKLNLIGLAILNTGRIERLELGFKSDQIRRLTELIREKQILNVVTNKSAAVLSSAKVYQALESMIEYKSEKYDYRYIFMSLSSVLNLQNKVIDTFKSERSNLLVIECKATKENIDELYNQLSGIIKSNNSKRIVLITQEDDPLAKKFKGDFFQDNKYEEKIDEENSLTDLTTESQEKLLEEGKVIFQEEEVSLGTLINQESKYIVDAEVLSKLISNEKIEIGKALTDLGEIEYYYIGRIFNRQVKIRQDFEKERFKFFVTRSSQVNEQELKEGQDIVLISDIGNDFKELCDKYKKNNIHWLKKEGNEYIWQRSHNELTNLREFVDTRSDGKYKVQANEITNIADRVVIVSAEPGMGKSTVLTKLAQETKKSDSSLWVVRVNLNDHTKDLSKISFSKNQGQAIDFFLSNIVDLKTPLEQELLKRRINDHGKVALLFDGFDEISPTYKEKVIKLVKILKDTKVEKLWVTTRPHMRSTLEDELSTLSYTLKSLSREDQEKFLKRFWNKGLDLKMMNGKEDDSRLNVYVQKLLDLLKRSIADKEVKFTGIPLQTRMLAEAFQDKFKEFYNSDQDKPDLPKKLDLIDLYQRFIDKKYNIYCEEKKKQDITNVAVTEDDDELRGIFRQNHQKAALYTLFNKDELRLYDIQTQRVNEFVKKVKDGKEKTGIIYQVTDDKPSFIHRTFAEYFAADWFTDNKDDQKVKDFLRKKIFEKENDVLRNFFDRMLAKDEQGENKYEIHRAVLNNDEQTVKDLLKQDGNIINTTDKAGRTALHLAAAYDHLGIVQVLLEHGANVSIEDKVFGWRPLSYADKGNCWSIAELLLQKGANGDDMFEAKSSIKSHSAYGEKETLLHIAAKEGYIEFAKVLVEKLKANFRATDNYNRIPLHLAAGYGKLKIVEFLLNKDKETASSKDYSGKTPLDLAVYRGQLEVVQYLGKKSDLSRRELNEMQLNAAASSGDYEVVKILLEKKVNVNSEVLGWTPLHQAAMDGSLKVVQILVENGAKIDHLGDNHPNPNVRDGWTPLHGAANNGHYDIVKYLVKELIKKEADINPANKDGYTPLHTAARKGHLNVVKYFIEELKVDINVADEKGTTSLHAAAFHGRYDIVKYLVEKKANINAIDKWGATVVFSAACYNDHKIINFLLDEKANIDSDEGVIGELGITVLHVAAMYGALEIVKRLVENENKDVNAGKDSFTPLHLAALSGDSKVIKYLINKGAEVNALISFSNIVRVLEDEGRVLENTSMNTIIKKLIKSSRYLTHLVELTPRFIYEILEYEDKESLALLKQNQERMKEFFHTVKTTVTGYVVNKYIKNQVSMLKEFISEKKERGDLYLLEQNILDPQQEEKKVSDPVLEECLPSTSSGRSKREVKIGECELSWEDVDEFNTEKDEKRDFSKIKIDGEKFINYIKGSSEEKSSQLIQLADKVKVIGESQSLVSRLIGSQKVINHLSRVGKISGMTMHGMMAKNVLADFLNGDYQGVAVNVGFIAGGQGFAKVAEAASLKGLKLASEGKLLLGKSLRAASPFLARGTSAFVIYDLVNQIKAFKNGTEEALVGVVGDSIYLGVDAAEIGIEIAEAFEVLEGVSSVTGPIGATIGAVVFVGTDVYMAVKRVDKIDQLIHLTGKEKFIEGLRAFMGMQPENHIQELLQEKEVSNELVRQGLEYLNKHSDIQSYVFPTGKSVVDSYRKVPYQTSDCASGGFGGGCFRAKTITRYAEECTTKFEIDLNNKVLLERKRTDIRWSRARPDNPSSGKLFCLPQGNDEPAPSYGSYLCENAIGLSANKTGNHTLISLGEGKDYAKGFLNSPNIFVVNNGSKEYYGGNKDDIFVLQADYVKGYLSGQGGINTLDTTSFAFQEEPLSIQLHIGEIVDYYRDNWLKVCEINKVVGRENKAETITVSCDGCNSNVKLIDGQGSNREIKDRINIIDDSCSYQMQIIVRPNTVVYNRALEGSFDYVVPLNSSGSAELSFIYGPERFNVNNTFWFAYEPANIKSIDVKYINVFNRTKHEVKFNFVESDREFNVTVSYSENPSYRLGNNGEIRIGNKDNLYMLQSRNESAEEIIKNYLPIANRLSKMSFFIQSLLSNETVVIGSGNHEVIHNNPVYKSHLVGNGGENVYVIDSEIDNVPEVIIHDVDEENSIDTIDLRNVVKKARGSFELQVIKSENDLLLRATVEKHEYFTVRLKDGVERYNKTHVIVENAPMRISVDENEWSLKPQPLMFEEVIVVTNQDVEKGTELITPRKGGNYTFVRSNGNDLIITNAFDSTITKDDLCSITLSKFYEVPKMKTLSIKFADKEIVLKDHEKEVSNARNMDVVEKEYKDQVYSDVFNHKSNLKLLSAVKKSNFDKIKKLINQGASVNAQDESVYGEKPIHIAAERNNKNIIEFLLSKGAKVTDTDRMGNTPLHYAAWKGCLEAARFLVDNGANINAADASTLGKKPIHVAAENNNKNIVEFLLEKGINVDEADKNKWTPLHWAASKGCLEVAKFLIEKGADINAENVYGKKTIHRAAENNNENIIELLLSKGVSVNDIDKDGTTPLYWASWNGNLDIVKYLIGKGADINAKDKNGKTPLDVAKDRGHNSIVECLEEKLKGERPAQRKRRHHHGDHNHHHLLQTPLAIDQPEIAASSSTRPSSWINDLFGWVKSSVSGLLGSRSSTTTKSSISQPIDVNGTIMLLDVIVRKFTGKQYIPAVDQSIPLLEARGYALNITNRFEKVLNKTAIKSGISVTNLNFDPVVVQSAIIGKIINGKFSEIAKTLYSIAKEACPKFKQTDKFIDHLKSNLEEVLAKQEAMILQQKIEKPYKDLSQEVSRKLQLSKKPDTFLNGTSVVQGISRAIN